MPRSGAKTLSTMGMQLRAGAATQKGLGRERNEDAYVLQVARGLFVVCDGMGGTSAGDVASQMAAATILRELQQLETASTHGGLDRGTGSSASGWLADAVRKSNVAIYRDGQQNSDRCEMGTTVVSAWLQREIASIASVGDSRAYLWRDQHLETLTHDHTLQEALAREGLHASREDLSEDPCDILLRVVGGEPDVEVDLVEIPVRSGDYLVLCTDGLTRIVPDPMVSTSISRLRDPQRICDQLVRTAARSGGTDDITVVIVEIVDTGAA
jgi:protein phosphatase